MVTTNSYDIRKVTMINQIKYCVVGFTLSILVSGYANHYTKNDLLKTFSTKGFNTNETDNSIVVFYLKFFLSLTVLY